MSPTPPTAPSPPLPPVPGAHPDDSSIAGEEDPGASVDAPPPAPMQQA
jgi:hypothetical protein